MWARMYDNTVHHGDSNKAALTVAHPRSLKIEPEIVFGLKQSIAIEGLDAADALDPSTGWRWGSRSSIALSLVGNSSPAILSRLSDCMPL